MLGFVVWLGHPPPICGDGCKSEGLEGETKKHNSADSPDSLPGADSCLALVQRQPGMGSAAQQMGF